MLIRAAELLNGRIADIRVEGDRIAAVGALRPRPDEPVIEARGSLLLPGLHDHHIHLAALAASLASVRCGPPDVTDEAGLARALGRPGAGWLRGIGYHENVAGLLNAVTLDRIAPDRPIRIQHRGGRMWFFNSAALDLLRAHDPPPDLDLDTGRLFEGDDWLRKAIGTGFPHLGKVGAMLARYGVTGVTDMSPANDAAVARELACQRATGILPQRVLLAGTLGLADAPLPPGIALGPAKLHLHEADLPALDGTIAFTRAAHAQGRPVAVHCVTEVELIFTLAMFREAGAMPGDRIEHASIAPDHAINEIAELGIAIVGQPHFIAERGDLYLRDVAAEDHALLYRLAGFRDAGVTLAAGSDAAFGSVDPWTAMAAAVARRTRDGTVIRAKEALTPEQALALYLADPADLTRLREIEVDALADLCLLDRSWAQARETLSSDLVRATIIAGRIVHDRVDQAPIQRGVGADPPA